MVESLLETSVSEVLWDAPSAEGDNARPRTTRVIIAGLGPNFVARIVAALDPADVLTVTDVSALWIDRELVEGFSPSVIVAAPALLEALKNLAPLGPKPPRAFATERPLVLDQTQHLSARQRQLLFLLSKGLRNKELAQQLSVSPRTVKAELSRLYAMFDVSNRTELVGAAVELGLLDALGLLEGDAEPNTIPRECLLPTQRGAFRIAHTG